jgi:hypothetical protein
LSDEVLAQVVEVEPSGTRMLVLSQDGVYRITLTLDEVRALREVSLVAKQKEPGSQGGD